ncbi:hypothetical protein [Streptomyces natalensis]|uniref:Uncharacterized protein n=1 Tax=Streptomyces natalensis ATCC 27448 TaxID=1240678 RepID=A0A0D7CF14_9ACTN|nr:hypothetical protein [Streptomyces natalensis]KIZ14475.1 hypothetical protein SNA_35950 [Streptomyces natalensis ATCC 27448]
MADDPYDWLDKDAAEQLLRGDSVSATGGDGARELQQLLKAAAALGAGPAQGTELPGEAAAVAAFRRAQHGSGARPRRRAAAGQGPTRTTRSGGLVERTRLARPFRRGFAVALAVCAISGVAVAAGTGVLPTPFQGGGPEPAATVSAAETPSTFASRGPGTETDGATTSSPSGSPGSGNPSDTPSPGASHGRGKPGGGKGGKGHGDDGGDLPAQDVRKKILLTLCLAYQRGDLDASAERRLTHTAGGADKVHAFCRPYLAGGGSGQGDNDGGTAGDIAGLTDGGAGGGATGSEDSGGEGNGQGGQGDNSHPHASLRAATPTGATTPAPTPTTGAPAPSTTPSAAATGQV